MHKIPLESLKTNTNYLKSCILYEVLSEKPILDCYRHFCERNGEDAMSFSDFDYYYYRFYSGDVDFEHERRIDSKEKTLTGLPLEILRMVTGYLRSKERVDLRLVSKKFKAIIDMEPVTFEHIHVEWTPNVFNLHINKKCFQYKINNGRFIRNAHADEELESALDLFAHVMKHPKVRVDRLDLFLPCDLFPEEREQLLKCLPHSLHVNRALIRGSVEETLTILSHLKPGVLKRVAVTGCPQELASVFESEHWKQAEKTNIVSYQPTSKSFPLYYGFRCFHIKVRSMDFNDLDRLIANVAKSPYFKCCTVKAVTVTSRVFVIPRPLKIRTVNDGSLVYCYQIPDSSHRLHMHRKKNGAFTIWKI